MLVELYYYNILLILDTQIYTKVYMYMYVHVHKTIHICV